MTVVLDLCLDRHQRQGKHQGCCHKSNKTVMQIKVSGCLVFDIDHQCEGCDLGIAGPGQRISQKRSTQSFSFEALIRPAAKRGALVLQPQQLQYAARPNSLDAD